MQSALLDDNIPLELIEWNNGQQISLTGYIVLCAYVYIYSYILANLYTDMCTVKGNYSISYVYYNGTNEIACTITALTRHLYITVLQRHSYHQHPVVTLPW